MTATITMQNTVGKIKIWGTGATVISEVSAVDQTDENADALLTEPTKVTSLGSSSEDEDFSEDTEHIQDQLYDINDPLVRLTSSRTTQRLFDVLQQWEGFVSEMTEDSVWASLVDLTDRTNSEEIVELPIKEFPCADRSILKPGSVFYWIIGREWSPGGQMRRVSEIRVRRTPQWSKHSVEVLHIKAKKLMDQFIDNAENASTSSQ